MGCHLSVIWYECGGRPVGVPHTPTSSRGQLSFTTVEAHPYLCVSFERVVLCCRPRVVLAEYYVA
eukprot:4944209-Prymnesium_polylepis.3